MNTPRLTLILIAALGLSACGAQNVVSRSDTSFTDFLTEDAAYGPLVVPSYTISNVNVVAPGTLIVSEANSYFPNADIVWREDPLGNRYEQIETILDDAITTGLASFDGARSVTLNVEINRFHSLTQKTRYSYGGTHDIDFDITIVDAETGEIVEPRRHFETSLPALGGQSAVNAEAMGQTQKVRITTYIGQLIYQDLTKARIIPAV